jgi:branched-subunit amino acid ABC-type transport system permease component
VDQLAEWLIQGVPIGCIYGLVAVGLVLTYKTSGVFNLAFSGQAFFSAWFFYDRVEDHGWPLWLGFVVTIFVVSPLVGLLLDRALFRYMRTSSWQVKLVSALGLLIAFPEIVKAIYSPTPAQFPPSVAPLIGIDAGEVIEIGDYTIGPNALVIIIFTVVAVVVLGIIFRYTPIGLQMRGVVESPRMVELAGVDADRVGAFAWMLSSTIAGLAGVLLAAEYFEINGTIYQLLIVAAIAAAAVGRFSSIPMTLVGAVIIGIGARALPDIVGGTNIADDLQPTFPFLVLFLLLVFWPKLREGKVASDPLAGVDPPPPAMAHEYKDEALKKTTKILFPVFILGFLVVMNTLVSSIWVDRLTYAFVLATIFLSITIFTGLGGQISLAQATFASVGAFTLANLFRDAGVPVMFGLIIGAVLAAVVGGLFVLLIDALPALIGRLRGRPPVRLSGLYLSLATLAFALMADKTIFRREGIIGGASGIQVERPDWLQGDHAWFMFVFGVFALVGFVVILIRKGTTGRLLAALRGSDPAAASVGINAMNLRIILFAFSAAVAGLGGGLLTLHFENATPNETLSILGIVWVVLVVTLGSRTVDGAANAAIGFVVFAWLLGELGFRPEFAVVFFGLGAITYARHPEGVVEFQTRKNIVNQIRQRALNARAAELKQKGSLPAEYRPVWQVALPVIAGPALYFVYILVRSAIQGHWVAVHSTTLLCFIVPSLLFALYWIFRTDFVLRRDGGVKNGLWLLLGGGVVGAALGWLFNEQGWPLHGSLLDCVLVGIPAGIAGVAFFLLPTHVERIARGRNWLSSPITWRDGRAPFGFLLAGALLFQRTTLTGSTEGNIFDQGSPPDGWPVFFLVCIFVIVWTQWVASVQGACNELAIGGEGYEPPEEHTAAVREQAAAESTAAPAPAPAGGGA